jgi:hypothetical protein
VSVSIGWTFLLVEQLTPCKLGVGLKIAQALGRTVPQAILMLVDEVIEGSSGGQLTSRLILRFLPHSPCKCLPHQQIIAPETRLITLVAINVSPRQLIAIPGSMMIAHTAGATHSRCPGHRRRESLERLTSSGQVMQLASPLAHSDAPKTPVPPVSLITPIIPQ